LKHINVFFWASNSTCSNLAISYKWLNQVECEKWPWLSELIQQANNQSQTCNLGLVITQQTLKSWDKELAMVKVQLV
jgi:hypothetical protein